MLKRLGQSLAWRIFPWANLSLHLNSDLRVCLMNRADFRILQEIFMEQSYTPFLSLLPEVRTWVDLGCNCGLFSLFLENWAREKRWPGPRRALLIEPNRYALRPLYASLRASKLTESFQVMEGVVTGHETEAEFFESKSTYRSSVFKRESRESPRRVPVINLDQATAGWPTVDLVKIDIEGGEKLVVAHWMAWLRKARFLLVEWHEPEMGGRDLAAAFAKAGFKLLIAQAASHLPDQPAEPLDAKIGTGLWANEAMPIQSLK